MSKKKKPKLKKKTVKVRKATVNDVVRFNIWDIVPIHLPWLYLVDGKEDSLDGQIAVYRIEAINRRTGMMQLVPLQQDEQ